MLKATCTLALVTSLGLGAACAPSPPPKEDPRVAELQKELETVKQKAAADQKAITEQIAEQKSAIEANSAAAQNATAAPNAAAAQNASAAQNTVAATEAAATRQAEDNARLRRELEEMKPREFTLPAGMVIQVRTTAELSTKSVKNGSVFEALLERDLKLDDTTLAKSGSRVTCVVVSSDPGGRVKGVASLSVTAKSIAGVEANTLAVRTDVYAVDARTTKGKDAARTGIATGVGAVIGGIAGGGKGAAIGAGAGAAAGVGGTLATRGAAAVIPTETLIAFKLTAPAKVVLRK